MSTLTLEFSLVTCVLCFAFCYANLCLSGRNKNNLQICRFDWKAPGARCYWWLLITHSLAVIYFLTLVLCEVFKLKHCFSLSILTRVADSLTSKGTAISLAHRIHQLASLQRGLKHNKLFPDHKTSCQTDLLDNQCETEFTVETVTDSWLTIHTNKFLFPFS